MDHTIRVYDTDPAHIELRSGGGGGAAGTLASAMPEQNTAVVLMTQYMPSEAYPVHAEFPKAVMADLAAMQAARQGAGEAL